MPPAAAHESILLWLRDDPSRLSALLALTGHSPCSSALAVEDSALRAAFPVEVTPDLVLRDPLSGRWVLVEVQLQPDDAKARRWPLAMAAMANRYGPRGELIVLTPSARVGRWARRVAVHHAGGTRLGVTPTVLRLGPKEADALLTNGPPELAIFAAWVMHGRRGPNAVDLARRAIATTEAIADAQLRQRMQWSILTVLHPAVVEKVRHIAMIDISQLPRNPALERWVSDLHAEGAGRMLLRLLHQRAIAMTPAEEARILACKDSAQIERWFDRAVAATRVDDVFATP